MPLLLVERDLKVLVAADIHLGLEHELWLCGVSIPSQTEKLLNRLERCLKEIKPDRLVLLGDTKHNVPKTSWQERKEVPSFLESLSQNVEVDLVPGNHDGGIADLAPQGIRVVPASGYVLDGIGYFHGHTWPSRDLFYSEIIVAGHIHPAIRLRDPLGHFIAKPVWARVPISAKAVESEYREKLPSPEMVIAPAFNHLCGGLPLNEPEEYERGPILTMAEIDSAKIYLLDGTDLGSLSAIKARDWHNLRRKR